MKIPEGLTEQEVVTIMQTASFRIAPRFKFGYLKADDLIQQGIMECIKVINADKFRPIEGKCLKRQLYNFLATHIRNRMSNYRRQYSFRYANPESVSNLRKFNLMHPLQIHSAGLTNSEMFSEENTIDDDIDHSALIEKIRANLDVNMLKDYLKWSNGVKLPTVRKKALLAKLEEIINGD
jgi:hypothetical protein